MKYTQQNGLLFIDEIQQFYEGKYLCGTPYKNEIKVTQEQCDYANSFANKMYPHDVYEFEYNGFYVEMNKNKLTDYKAKFIEWTEDPGVGKFKCSDGKERLIPTCSISISFILPKQIKTNLLFGVSSSSK